MNVHAPADLGLLIREERRRQGLDQKTLAVRVGVSRQWIIEVEKGKPGAPIGLVLRTLRVLGVTLRAGDTAGPGSTAGSGVDLDAIVERARAVRPRGSRGLKR